MTAVVPSYLAKVHRAEKHLVDLEEEIQRYSRTKPYTVREALEGNKKPRMVRRLQFTGLPENTDIPIIAADAIYNLRSALDHLMSALVASKDRNSAMFPIYFQGVWEVSLPGENQQRVKERARWASDVKTIHPDAVAFLKSCQPLDDRGDGETANLLRFVNRLSNRDRHEKLPVVMTGLEKMVVRFKWPDGSPQTGLGIHARHDSMFEDGAEIRFPASAMDMEIEGSPVIAIRVAQDLAGRSRFLQIPSELGKTAAMIKDYIIPGLVPFARR